MAANPMDISNINPFFPRRGRNREVLRLCIHPSIPSTSSTSLDTWTTVAAHEPHGHCTAFNRINPLSFLPLVVAGLTGKKKTRTSKSPMACDGSVDGTMWMHCPCENNPSPTSRNSFGVAGCRVYAVVFVCSCLEDIPLCVFLGDASYPDRQRMTYSPLYIHLYIVLFSWQHVTCSPCNCFDYVGTRLQLQVRKLFFSSVPLSPVILGEMTWLLLILRASA